jgi:Barstar (barnase inhibitor)
VTPISFGYGNAMTLLPGINEVTPEEADAAKDEAIRTGASVFVISTAGAANRADVFDRVRASLPLDPPLVGSKSWDALADSLWGGVDSLDASVVVIIWSGASDLRRNAPEDFMIATTIFRDVASSLGKWVDTDGEPKQVCVYLS